MTECRLFCLDVQSPSVSPVVMMINQPPCSMGVTIFIDDK